MVLNQKKKKNDSLTAKANKLEMIIIDWRWYFSKNALN